MKLFIILMSLIFSGYTFAGEFGQDCQFNCVKTRVVGNKFVVEQINDKGKSVKIETIKIGKNAKVLKNAIVENDSIINSFGTQGTTLVSGTTKTHTKTYETATEIVVIVITEYYDNEGNLINVVISEQRFPRAAPNPNIGK